MKQTDPNKKKYLKTVFRKVLVPVIHGCDFQPALKIARAAAEEGQVILIGLVRVPAGESLSAAALQAREVRQSMKAYARDARVRIEEHVHASYDPWSELAGYIRQTEPDLLVLECPKAVEELNIPSEALDHPPCDIALIAGPVPSQLNQLLVPVRGGPYAGLGLSLALAVARTNAAQVSALHILPPGMVEPTDAPFRGIDRVLARLPEVQRRIVATDSPAKTIRSVSREYDLVVLGASAHPAGQMSPLGPVADEILQENCAGVVVVRTSRPAPISFESELASQNAISVLVDKWFAENTYHANEFEDLDTLLELKQRQGVTISLALPALNEEETVGTVIQTVRSALIENVPLLDEIVLIDSNSTDRTRQIAEDLGVPVYIHQEILPQYGARRGKGEALWKSLHVTQGDIVLWIDTDIVNIQPHFVYGLIGPLLLRSEVQLVKGFYQRPLRVGDKLQASGGGRVTELTARPLLNLLYPELSGLFQPLAGEYGGRRAALEKLPFSSGYGVEIGLLIDLLENFGLNAIAQVDLMERVHHNQPLEALSKMSFTIIQTVFRKLERRYHTHLLDEANRTMKLIRYEPGRFYLDVEEIAEQERPPMIELPEYRKQRGL